MKLKPKITLIDHFSKLTDPRIERTKEHKLIDILTIAICGMICGADNWVAIEQYGNSKQELKKVMVALRFAVTGLCQLLSFWLITINGRDSKVSV
jgi:hypothetical protein